MAQTVYYDRAKIYIGTAGSTNFTEYLAEGQIKRFGTNVPQNSSLIQGFSPTGNATGLIYGNISPSFTWTETLTQKSDFINWSVFAKANPDLVIRVVPFSIAMVQSGPEFTFQTIAKVDESLAAQSEGTDITRTLSLIAVYYNA